MFSELSKALGAEETVEYEGKVYRLAPSDRLEVIAAWQEWLGDCALEFFMRPSRQRMLGPDGVRKACEAVAKLEAEGAFSFFGETSNQRLFTLDGQKRFIYLRLKLNDDSVTEEMAKKIVESRWEHLARILMKESAAAAADPNAEAPAPTTAAGENSGGQPSSPDSSSTASEPLTKSES